MDPDEVSLEHLPVEAVVLVSERDRRPVRAGPVLRTVVHAPAGGDPGVRVEVTAFGEVEPVAHGLVARRQARHLDDERTRAVGECQADLGSVDGPVERYRLDELDPFRVLRARLRLAERDPRIGAERRRRDDRGQEHGAEQRRKGAARGRVQSSHASPAMRTAPSPFWSAPSSSGRDSAQPVP